MPASHSINNILKENSGMATKMQEEPETNSRKQNKVQKQTKQNHKKWKEHSGTYLEQNKQTEKSKTPLKNQLSRKWEKTKIR